MNADDVVLTELELAQIEKLTAELQVASTKLAASYALWLRSQEVQQLKSDQEQAKRRLNNKVVEIMKAKELDPKSTRFSVKDKKFVARPSSPDVNVKDVRVAGPVN